MHLSRELTNHLSPIVHMNIGRTLHNNSLHKRSMVHAKPICLVRCYCSHEYRSKAPQQLITQRRELPHCLLSQFYSSLMQSHACEPRTHLPLITAKKKEKNYPNSFRRKCFPNFTKAFIQIQSASSLYSPASAYRHQRLQWKIQRL